MTIYLAEPARSSPLAFSQEETKTFIEVLAKRQERNRDCCKELFFGIFFDGTGNNEEDDRPKNKQSNVTRLRRVFPQNKEADAKKPGSKVIDNFFPIYAPGVGTTFRDVGDTGEGDDLVWGETDRKRGLAFAEKGEARIVWALLSVLNSVSYSFTKSFLLDFDKIKKLSNDLTEANVPLWAMAINPRLAAVAQWINKRKLIDAKRNEVLVGLCRELEKKIQPFLNDEPKVLGIRLSVFGFSRGSAQARVFSNWFVDMCRAASGDTSLVGFPVEFDFLGIFDTVASVGLANSWIIADGHMEWADAERSLRIPEVVTQCLHLVSAHEVRRSFPLDSIVEASKTRREFVYPGVHSDLGGGYLPCEQGRGTDAKGDDMLSRVALAHMYRAARLANVPLDVDGQGVAASAKAALTVADSTRVAFNAYLDQCKVKEGTLAEIMDEQTRLYVRWRRMRLDMMDTIASVKRAPPQDRTDILEANKELAEEAKRLQEPTAGLNLRPYDQPIVTLLKLGRHVAESMDKRGVDAQHYKDWQRLKPDWESSSNLAPAVSRLFEDWVHDSRAWFKPLGDDDHIWERKQKKRMEELDKRQRLREEYRRKDRLYEERKAQRREEEQKVRVQRAARLRNIAPRLREAEGGANQLYEHGTNTSTSKASVAPHDLPDLSDSEKRELAEWKATGLLPPQLKGREPFMMGSGYLLYRRVYHGSDANIVMMASASGARRT